MWMLQFCSNPLHNQGSFPLCCRSDDLEQHFAVRERCICGPGVETTMNHLSAGRSPVEYGGSKFRPLFQKVLLIWCGSDRWHEILQRGLHCTHRFPPTAHEIATSKLPHAQCAPHCPMAHTSRRTRPVETTGFETLYLLSRRPIPLTCSVRAA
jgi:hypothetical protein